ncbi:MAG: hypothetical protein WCC53_05075 [Thermoanaerobaculia bacterium]|jgi:hypothetical protein
MRHLLPTTWKGPLGAVAAVLLATPLALAAQTPTPTRSPGAVTGTFDAGKSYVGVRTQQGRVQTDADWNEQLQACKRRNDSLARQLKTHANALEIQLRQLQAAADKADDNIKKGSQDRDHNKAIKDAIRKMLDQIAEINRATKF